MCPEVRRCACVCVQACSSSVWLCVFPCRVDAGIAHLVGRIWIDAGILHCCVSRVISVMASDAGRRMCICCVLMCRLRLVSVV